MLLRRVNEEGEIIDFEFAAPDTTLGRGRNADLIIPDPKASRLHCGIRRTPEGLEVHDLKSKNGTYVNEERVDVALLQPGDRLRIGDTVLTVVDPNTQGPTTMLHEVEREMSEGKGYRTILRKIVDEVEENAPPSQASGADSGGAGSSGAAPDGGR